MRGVHLPNNHFKTVSNKAVAPVTAFFFLLRGRMPVSTGTDHNLGKHVRWE